MVSSYNQSRDPGWDRGREGYLDVPQKPVYAPVAKPGAGKSQASLIAISTEERMGSLIAAGGMIWGAYSATQNFAGSINLDLLRQGPMEVCALGIVIWLHAKWRRSTHVK